MGFSPVDEVSRRKAVGTAAAASAALLVGAGTTRAAGAGPGPAGDGGLEADVRRPSAGGGARQWIRLVAPVGQEERGEKGGGQDPTPVRLHLPAGGGKSGQSVRSDTGRTGIGTARESAPARSAQLAGGDGQSTVWLTALSAGEPLKPADTLRISTAAGVTLLDVYIEPAGGRWTPAGRDGKPLDLEIVSVHAAHLRTSGGSEDVMWSPPRKRDRNGDPMPDRNDPGQWEWNLHALNDVETRALDVQKLTTRNREMDVSGGDPDKFKKVNIFCGGAAHLPDGRLFVVGGHIVHHEGEDEQDITNAQDAFVYDPALDKDGGWKKLEEGMSKARWYPTVTAMPDGRMLVSCGSSVVLEGSDNDADDAKGYFANINNDYDVFDFSGASPRRVKTGPVELVDLEKIPNRTGDKKYRQQLSTYANVFVLPKGEDETWVAIIESNRGWLTRYHSRERNPMERADARFTMSTKGSRSYPTYGSAVLLPFGPEDTGLRILTLGGQSTQMTEHRSLSEYQQATDTAEILTIDTEQTRDAQPGWHGTANSMHTPRQLCDATLLTDGTVLVSGGAGQGWGNLNHDYEEPKTAELFDPVSEKFAVAATARTDRRYHATALLQPDGTVLKAGSTGGFDDARDRAGNYKYLHTHTDAERYWPPYLFRGPRPLIDSLHGRETIAHGRSLQLTVSGPSVDENLTVAVIRLGSTTHGNEMDQRYVRLEVEVNAPAAGGRRHLSVKMPKNPAAAPPGDYLLAVVDSAGVPSEAPIITIRRPV